jgi:hypothetical protein
MGHAAATRQRGMPRQQLHVHLGVSAQLQPPPTLPLPGASEAHLTGTVMVHT